MNEWVGGPWVRQPAAAAGAIHGWPGVLEHGGAAVVGHGGDVGLVPMDGYQAGPAADPGPLPADVEHDIRIYVSVYMGGVRLTVSCSCGGMKFFDDGVAEAVLHNTANLHREGGPLS